MKFDSTSCPPPVAYVLKRSSSSPRTGHPVLDGAAFVAALYAPHAAASGHIFGRCSFATRRR
jgi:hypothetical protein